MSLSRSTNHDDAGVPPTEVEPRAKRRRYSAAYKEAILAEADTCRKPGELGALLRREGLYSSHLAAWRKQRDQAGREGLAGKPRGPKTRPTNPLDRRVRELERENERLRKRAQRAEALVEVQKKVSQLLGVVLPTPDDEMIS